jgi:hypothetical protein
MAKVIAPPAHEARYEDDFYLWTRHQVELLRARRFDELDLPHLIEEVEDLGTSQRKEVFSRSQQLLRHLLKLEHSPAAEPRRGWLDEVDDQRDELRLTITPSLRRELEQTLPERYAQARRRAAKDLAGHGEAAELPQECPYTVDQILDPDWRPANRHGIVTEP